MGREATEAALLAQRDDLAMIGIGCTAKQHGEKVWFIHPEGRFRKVWDFCQSFLLLYVAIMVPLRMGFDMEAEIGDGDWWVELFVDMYFISDIVFNFRTGVYDSDGVLITDRTKIRRKYLVRRLCPLRHACGTFRRLRAGAHREAGLGSTLSPASRRVTSPRWLLRCPATPKRPTTTSRTSRVRPTARPCSPLRGSADPSPAVPQPSASSGCSGWRRCCVWAV